MIEGMVKLLLEISWAGEADLVGTGLGSTSGQGEKEEARGNPGPLWAKGWAQ